MAYAAISFSALEQPTLAKWNILGTNDAYFNTQIGANFSSGTTSTVWWEELGRTTLGGNASSLTVSSIPARKYLSLIMSWIPSGILSTQIQFNGDTGANYSYAYSFNGAANALGVSQNQLFASPNGGLALAGYSIIDFVNITAQEKIGFGRQIDVGAAGAGSAPSRSEFSAKWANTSAQISSVVFKTSTNNFAAGTSLIVLGHD